MNELIRKKVKGKRLKVKGKRIKMAPVRRASRSKGEILKCDCF